MPLASGFRIGPYEVVTPLGSGGMGDVYRATDTRLDRTVAIKVIRTDFSERFEREARSISALNHPHICTLHDVGRLRAEGATASQGDAFCYLVMEFIDGAPIAGPLPLGDVLRFGLQICDALHAAHQKGIVHRDLKPANILTTKGGIKLLDFGLAKPHTPGASQAGDQATVAALTGAHTVLGTPQYMAPEQIEGREVDVRTDIFALGCVLYELVTGKRAFDGKTASSVMAAILAAEPRKPSELVPVTPPELEWLILRCLEKDPDSRYQSARDVGLQLKWIGEHPAPPAALASSGSKRGQLLAGVAAGALATALAGGAWLWSGSRASSSSSGSLDQIAMTVATPPKISLLNSGLGRAIALSPDGRTIVFVGQEAGNRSALYVRRLDQFEAVRIAGTDGASGPFFSPDGRWLGFGADEKLRKIPIAGGAAVDICDAPLLRGAVWLADDTIAFSPYATGGLMRVPAQTGTPVTLTTLDASKNEKTHRGLVGLPGGKTVVFVIGSNEIDTYDEGRIVALNLETKQVTELAKGYAPAFSPTGHLLYVHKSTVFAIPFDPASLTPGGSPVQVLKDVSAQPAWGTADFVVAPNGVLAYIAGGDRSELHDVRWVDRNTGKIQPTGAPEGFYTNILASPDGQRLAFMVIGANNSLWTYDLAGGKRARITERLDAESPVWSHDGTQLTYWSGFDVRSISVDGTHKEEVLISAADAAGRTLRPVAWSEDGQTLALSVKSQGKSYDATVYSRRDRKVRTVLETRFDEWAEDLSPDGRWLVYTSGNQGHELSVLDLSTSIRYPVSNRSGGLAEWAKKGRELVFDTDQGVFAVPFTPGSPPVLGKPERLLGDAKEEDFDNVRGVAVMPDGSRFAVLVRRPLPPLTEIRMVTSWAQHLAGNWK